MIVHPTRDRHLMGIIPGSRILKETFNLIGHEIVDRQTPGGKWLISGVYAPIAGRKPQGIRVKVTNPMTQAVTFVEQLYLEVALSIAEPGSYCLWSQSAYPAPGSSSFHALVCDDDDLEDDLYDRELIYRDLPDPLPEGSTIERTYQSEPGAVFHEILTLVNGPANRGPNSLGIQNIDARWKRVERSRRA